MKRFIKERGLAALMLATLCVLLSSFGDIYAAENSADANQPPQRELEAPKSASVTVNKQAQLVMQGKEPYSCAYCDLQGQDFSNANLSNANLTGANLANANFTSAVLDGASFTGANLKGANFSNAQLNDSANGATDLSRANLQQADFKGAQTTGADLQYADTNNTSMDESFKKKVRWSPTFDQATVNDWQCATADLSGLTSKVYVSTTGADSASCGSTASGACKTISQGIQNCAATGCGVLVEWGEYTPSSTISLRDGVNVYGGCLPASAENSSDYFSVVTGPADGSPAISGASINTATIVQGFQVTGASIASSDGSATTAMIVSSSDALQILTSEIIAGSGGTGAAGTDATPGTKGGDASSGTGGTVSACSNTSGGNGSVKMDVSVSQSVFTFKCNPSCSANSCYGYSGQPGDTASWASGGKWGDGNCAECPSSRGTTGTGGGTGKNGVCGKPGSASSDVAGKFVNGVWTGSIGAAGTKGTSGGGGGGGGAGGFRAGGCFWVKTENPGNKGGGGGAGACGATQATGGQQGGGAFAVVLVDSTVSFNDSRIVGGRSGDGGKGGHGGDGAKGGAGAKGNTNEEGGYGGKGGDGGISGASGGGAGGNSGPSVGIALVGSSVANMANTPYYLGNAGAVGTGGNASKSDGLCSNVPAAADGMQGDVASARNY